MRLGKAKMWAALVGGTATAVATFAATMGVAFEDNGLDVGEVGLAVTALATLLATVRSVWAVENKPVSVESVERLR